MTAKIFGKSKPEIIGNIQYSIHPSIHPSIQLIHESNTFNSFYE